MFSPIPYCTISVHKKISIHHTQYLTGDTRKNRTSSSAHLPQCNTSVTSRNVENISNNVQEFLHQDIGKNMYVCESMWHIPKNKNQITQNITFQPKIPIDYSSNGKHVSWHKIYAKGFDGFKYVLVATCKITNFVLAIPIKTTVAQLAAEALIHKSYMYFSPSKLLIVDKDLAFTGEVIHFLLRVINYQLKIKKTLQSCQFKNRVTDTNYWQNDNKTLTKG